MNLFPEGYENEIMEPEELLGSAGGTVIGYRGSIYFDGTDLVRDGLNKLRASTGIEAWEQWCTKCLSTERYKYPIYPTDFGIETEEAFHAVTRDLAESILYREITEALKADPYGRTSYVENIVFDWQGSDSLYVSVSVIGIENASIDIIVKIGGEAAA